MILPGDALKARLEKLSIYTAGGCGCRSLANQMNELGLERCRLKRDELAAKVKGAAAGMGYKHDSLDHFAGIVDAALDDATASLGPPVPINSLAVVACYFNPCHYLKPRENFKRFAAGIRSAKVPLHAIELAFDQDEFETDAEFKVRGSSQRHKLWQKERLLNLVIQRVGHQYDALAWIDADILLTRVGWAEAAKQLLSHYPVIQLFRQARDLNGKQLHGPQRPSMASAWPRKEARNPNATHPGYAWAGRSDWLLKYGLEDQMVVGGGDCTTMKALQGDSSGEIPFDRSMSPEWKAAYKQWAAPLAAEVAGRIGFLDQTIVHLWHGSARDRHYVDRWAYVANYNPATDTHTDETGLIAWTDHAIEHKPDMVRQVADYFSLRNEDGPVVRKPNNQHGHIPAGQVLVPTPPPLHLTPRSDKALVTVAVGEEATANLAITRPYMEAYAARVGADFVVLDWPGHPQWTMSCKYAIPRTFDHYERIAFVDADVLLRPGCLNLFEQCSPYEYGFCDELWLHKRVHGHERVEHDYYAWRAKTGLPAIKIPWYLNGGVIVAPRSHREILTASSKPMWPGFLVDQEWQMTQLLQSGLPYRIMDRRANWQWWSDKGFQNAPADAVLHFSGLTKGRTAEIARWAAKYPLDNWFEIDARHREWIRQELMTGRYRRVLEIGSHRGFSTRAFVEAWQAGAIDELHLCEPNPTPELLELIARTPAVLHRCTSLELLAKDCRWDLVFADGDHSAATVEPEAKLLLAAKVPAVFAHDVAADPVRYPGCQGAKLYRELFERAGYHLVEDSRPRPGERTDRGLMLAQLSRDSA